jgi:hypothetical protein
MTQRARKRDFRDGSISEFFNSIGGERPFIDNALKVRSHARIGRPAAHGGRLRPNRGRSPSRIPALRRPFAHPIVHLDEAWVAARDTWCAFHARCWARPSAPSRPRQRRRG